MTPRVGPGVHQWNRGGWFGSQLGSTLWLILLGALTVPADLAIGCAVIACGLIPNAIGSWLWWRRDSIAPYPALQGLIGVTALCALVAMFLMQISGRADPQLRLSFLLIFPGLMLMFHLRERASRSS